MASPSTDSPVSPPTAGQASQTASTERSTFLSRAGHEMRNPLSNILALVEGIQDGIYGDIGLRQSEALGTISENAQRLLTLVNGFLDAEKIHVGGIALQSQTFDLEELAAQASKQLRPIAESRSLDLRHAVSPQAITTEGDCKRLLQIMLEVLGCVLVSVPAKGKAQLDVIADPARQSLIIRAWGGSPTLTISAQDETTPSAVAMDRLRKLKGIGVSLVETLIKLHGDGELVACELPGNGLLVKARLPLNCSLATDAQGATIYSASDLEDTFASSGSDSESHATGSPLILLVDDEDVLRNITHDYLESVGYRVLAATNGREALELANHETPDLVIMDMLMPIMDGMETLQKIRQSSSPSLAQVPIIAMSGLAVPAERDKCMAAGADACLVKPFGIKQLEMAMNQFLSSRHTNTSA
ncbi:response regulator [Roseimicrobium gellanilyticum]|uniref:response regulator n=1 Tax=Roseimicrobium gellanilyticum TaxID=748857 RepID=UPI001B8668C9|nr:hybrid sensor histidine kinase/response regulator [Roseimicrobium gellanilyticum]